MKDITNEKAYKKLCTSFLLLKNEKECAAFLRDICTVSELTAMTERLSVAKMVSEGITYREIAKTTGASTATITRVAHWLHHGEGGYGIVLDKLK